MQITNIEMKTASNGNQYKQVTFAQKSFGDKDRTNVFNNHSLYAALVVGYDVPQDMLYVNPKGYLEIKDETPKKKGGANEQTTNRVINIESYVIANNTMLKNICKHLGVSTMGTVGNTDIPYPDKDVDVFTKEEQINSEDMPW